MNEDPLYLYRREGAYIPRIAAVHDLCGYGKCSLGVAIPVLSAAGCDVCPVPTGLFSSHTAFPGWYMHDTTEMLADYLAAWKNIGVEIDAVYSGFLGAPEQVDRIRDLYGMYPDALRVVDPGDGRPWQGVPHLHARAVRRYGGAGVRRRHPARRTSRKPPSSWESPSARTGAAPTSPTTKPHRMIDALVDKGREARGAEGHPARGRAAHPQLRGRRGHGCGGSAATSTCPTCCTARATCMLRA